MGTIPLYQSVMTTQPNIDDMTTEQLHAALKSDLNALDGNQEPQADDDQAPSGEDDQKKDEEVKADPAASTEPKGDDDDAKGDDDTKTPDDKNPYRKRIDRLTRTKHRLEDEKKATETENERLRKENELLRQGKDPEPKGSTDPDEDDEDSDKKPQTDVRAIIREELEAREKSRAADDTDKAELDELFDKNPNAKDRKAEILELGKKHPTLSYEALDKLLAPEDYVDEVEANRKNAKKMTTGARSKADLSKDVDPNKMTTDELGKLVRDQIASGKLVV